VRDELVPQKVHVFGQCGGRLSETEGAAQVGPRATRIDTSPGPIHLLQGLEHAIERDKGLKFKFVAR
jgi:hypothetical protein